MKCIKLFIFLIFQFDAFAQVNRMTLNAPVSPAVHFFQQQDDSYQYREDDYDPRHEGIKSTKRQDVTSDKIELLSATVLIDVPEIYSDSLLIHLGIYTPEPVSPKIDVSYDRKLYYMDPVRDWWGPGFSTFKWPGDIIVRNQIPLNELHARAILIEDGKRIFYPACLYYGQFPDSIYQYQFLIVPLMPMEIQYRIIEAKSETSISSGSLGKVKANQTRPIIWRFIDEQGTSSADGEYVLRLDGSYRNSVGQLKKVNVAYRFTHRSNFLE